MSMPSMFRPSAVGPRERLLTLPLLAAVLLAACNGGGAPEERTDSGRSLPLTTLRAGELAAHVQSILREREKQRAQGVQPAPTAGPASLVATAGATDAPPAHSQTLVQEAGVDEADLLKTDGTHLYSLAVRGTQAPRLRSHRRAADGSLSARGAIELSAEGQVEPARLGLLLASDGRAGAVLGQRWMRLTGDQVCADACPPTGMVAIEPYWAQASVEVQRFALADGVPSLGEQLRIDGRLVDSRRVGDRLVLVTVHQPLLALDLLPAGASAAEREAAIARLRASDVLPRVRASAGSPVPLVADTECWAQRGNASTAVEITTITVLDLASPTLARTSRCFVGGTEALYMTPTTLVLATTRWSYATAPQGWQYPADIRTDIHKFALGATTAEGVSYRGSGEVAGHLGWNAERKSLRLSEHAGVLRVLSFTGQFGWATVADASGGPPPSPATLTLLRERSGEPALEVVSTLPNARRPAALGKPGEQVHGVRFVGERGYLVTFRVIDPLYVLDLSDPADPRVAGELELPGVSDHLVPLPGGLLFGVGRDASPTGALGGVKVALFDVSDPQAPREIAQQAFGSQGSSTALDGSRHGLNLLERGGVVRLALPLAATARPWQEWTSGLQRFEVDLQARQMAALPALGLGTQAEFADTTLQRSVQIGDHVYFLRGGELAGYAW